MHEAFEAVTPTARRCLGPGDRVTVEGFFDGPTGRFRAERVGAERAETSPARRTCVSMALEAAQVRPFTVARRDAQWTVAGPELSAVVRAMIREEARPEPDDDPMLGEVDARAVNAVLLTRMRDYRACYEDALRGDPSLRGVLEVRFTLNVDGRVAEATGQGPAELAAVRDCVLGGLRETAFPRPRGASVDYVVPLRFEPESSRGSMSQAR